MSNTLYFESTLSEEEIIDNFKDCDFFSSIVESLNEAIAYEKGEKNVHAIVRTRSIPVADIVKIRTSLSMTQKSFANLLGVSRRTVEAWECGRSNPSPTAKKLLFLIEKDSSVVQTLSNADLTHY